MCLTAGANPGDTIRFALPGWVELELVEVSGQTKLPLQYLYTRKFSDNLIDVSAPTYWIGKFEITRKQYEAVMGETETPGNERDERLPVTNIKWKDAVEFCDRLNQVAIGDIPPGYRFDLPTIVEWAHAFDGGRTNSYRYSGSDDIDAVAWHGVGKDENVISYDSIHLPGLKQPNAVQAYDMSGNVAEYVFVADVNGGNIRMGGSYMWPEHYCELRGTAGVAKDGEFPDLGFRVALVQNEAKDPSGRSYAMGTKGRILLRSGCPELARKYLSHALELGGMSPAESKLLNDDWLKADKACGYDVGTWSGLLNKLTQMLEGMDYCVEDYLRFWNADPSKSGYDELRQTTRNRYRRQGIYGMRVDVRELPKEISRCFAPSTSKKVQAVLCDFTGDGLLDLVVEMAGHTDPNGEQYGFFERKKEGGYELVGEPIRTVGMCVIHSKQKQVFFLVMIKRTDNVLTPGVIDCTEMNGKSCLRIGWPLERSYSISDRDAADLDARLPFIGKRTSAKVRRIAEGKYERPLCWPWK